MEEKEGYLKNNLHKCVYKNAKSPVFKSGNTFIGKVCVRDMYMANMSHFSVGYIFLFFLKGFAKAQKETAGVRLKAKFSGKSNEASVLKTVTLKFHY